MYEGWIFRCLRSVLGLPGGHFRCLQIAAVTSRCLSDELHEVWPKSISRCSVTMLERGRDWFHKTIPLLWNGFWEHWLAIILWHLSSVPLRNNNTTTVLRPFVRTAWVSWYQKKHSPTHHPDHPIFISVFYLPRSIVSSLFKLRAWQFFCTTFLHVLFGPHIPYYYY